MKKENEMTDLVTALATAQAEMQNAPLNKVNPHFKSKYADLSAIRDAAIPALSRNGVACVQLIETREHGPVVVTKLLKGGEEIVSECPVMVADKTKPQLFGSALTYARRYALASIVGISADEDDDANAANDGGDVSKPKGNPPGITKFRQESREFYREMNSCEDYDQYVAFTSTPEARDFMEKARSEFPKDWEGDGGDIPGIKADMAALVDTLKQKDAA